MAILLPRYMRRGLDDEKRTEERACLLEAGMEIWRWHSLDNPGWNTELFGTYRATSRDFWVWWVSVREKWTESMNVHLNVYKWMSDLIVESPLDCKDLQVANVVALLHWGQFPVCTSLTPEEEASTCMMNGRLGSGCTKMGTLVKASFTRWKSGEAWVFLDRDLGFACRREARKALLWWMVII